MMTASTRLRWPDWLSLAAALAVLQLLAGNGGAGAPTDAGTSTAPPPPTETYSAKQDQNLKIDFRDNEWLKLTCLDGFSLGAYLGALRERSFQERKVFSRLNVSKCPPDAGVAEGVLRTALDTLNATLQHGAALALELPTQGPALAARHLQGITVSNMTLLAVNRRQPPPAVAGDLLTGDGVSALRSFVAYDVPVPAATLATAGKKLDTLVLMDTGTERVPAALLAQLRFLIVKSSTNTTVELEGGSAKLGSLTLLGRAAAGVRTDWSLFPNLTELSLSEWGPSETTALAWSGCGSLRSLTLSHMRVTALPAGWLGACCALRELRVFYACALDLGALPETLLDGCGAQKRPELTTLALRYSGRLAKYCVHRGGDRRNPAAVRLPALLGLNVALAPNLRELDLSNNGLSSIEGGMFASLSSLQKLNLSGNRLDKSIYSKIHQLRQLTALDLSFNAHLGNACNGSAAVRIGESQLKALTALRVLNLRNTAVSLICRDWRRDMTHLETLNLDHTKVTRLTMEDLLLRRTVEAWGAGAEMSLLGAPVVSVYYSDEDVRTALTKAGDFQSRAHVRLDQPLNCDCDLYNAVFAWRQNNSHVNLDMNWLKCRSVGDVTAREGGRDLSTVSLEELVCPINEKCSDMPTGCKCWERPQREHGSTADATRRMGLVCEGLGLHTMPPTLPPWNGSVEWELHFRNNSITELNALPQSPPLPAADPRIKILDLRDNGLRRVSASVADALASSVGAGASRLEALRLAGNPLQCDCGADAAPLLRAAASLGGAGVRLEDARCAAGDARSLAEAAIEVRRRCAPELVGAGSHLSLYITLGSLLTLLALLAMVTGAALARPSRRARLKGVLVGWGWLPRPDGDMRSFDYDAFVSFVAADVEFVNEMSRRLEGPKGLEKGETPLRLCLHHRDWAPGEFVPAQIAASVRAARRTVCVVSRAFLGSEWVRAEFYEALAAGARDGTPRLVVVLLEEPSLLQLPRQLRRYVTNNTYLRSDNPQLWTLLRRAVQAPSVPAARPSVPSSVPSVPAALPSVPPSVQSVPAALTPVAHSPAPALAPESATALEPSPTLARAHSVSESSGSSSSTASSSSLSSVEEAPAPEVTWRGAAPAPAQVAVC